MTKENKEANVGEVRVKERNATTTKSVKSSLYIAPELFGVSVAPQ